MHFEVERCGGSSMSVLPATTVIQSREAAARKILDSATCVAVSTCCAMSACNSARIASFVGVGRASDRTRAHTVLEASDGSSLLLCHELRSAGQHSNFLQHIIESPSCLRTSRRCVMRCAMRPSRSRRACRAIAFCSSPSPMSSCSQPDV